jgi:hypothetical protein
MSSDMPHIRCDSEEKCSAGVLFDCDYVFRDITVLPVREGGTMVQWTLHPQVRDRGEYRYTLQVGSAGVTDKHAWKDVVSEPDVWCLIDPVQRLRGNFSFTHYRIRLNTGERSYHSVPLHTMGRLKYEDWRVYVSVMRAEHVQLSGKTGIPGLLYKRRISGIPCQRCRDFNTGEVRDSHCPDCFGTGWFGGYYKPMPCAWFNVDPADASIQYDVNTQGPVTNTRYEARAIASPLLITGDVWLNRQSSERFRIMQVMPIVEQKGIPVVYKLAMERLPFSDITYKLPRTAT